MLEHAAALLTLLGAGRSAALVTITRVVRSSPRAVGTSMVVTADARVIGSLSSGCAEGDAVLLALGALGTGQSRRATFGLACGGTIDVVAHRVRPEDEGLRAVLEDVVADRPAALGLVRTGSRAGRLVPLGPTDPSPAADVLVLRHDPRPRLVVLGAGEHAVALTRLAAASGFAVSVCDPSALLATRERFPDAVEVVVGDPAEHLAAVGPDARTAVCVLTHDVRLDVPALLTALASPAGFVGAMGSRATVARRAALLREAGLGEDALARLRSPIGLDLGGSTEAETALAILAEIVAVRHGASARSLTRLTGPVHGEAARVADPRNLRHACPPTTRGAVA